MVEMTVAAMALDAAELMAQRKGKHLADYSATPTVVAVVAKMAKSMAGKKDAQKAAKSVVETDKL